MKQSQYLNLVGLILLVLGRVTPSELPSLICNVAALVVFSTALYNALKNK